MEQDRLPLCEALERYAGQASVRLHMPGHKGKGDGALQAFPLAWDVTEVPGTGDLYAGEGPIAQAEALAAQAFGAGHSFFSTGGASLGIFAMLAVTLRQGDHVLVGRDAHRSAIDAMALLGLEPVWLPVGCDSVSGLPGVIAVETLSRAIRLHPEAKAVLITYPNYYGLCADIGKIAKVAHAANLCLLVDEAHGSHFAFHPELPMSAGAAGADMWVDSAHKTLPALTQGAILHATREIDPAQVRRAMALGGSSSPNYLIMASLDIARQTAAVQGQARLRVLMEALRNFRDAVSQIVGLSCPGLVGRAGVFCQDPTRLVLSVNELGMTGYAADQWLREHFGIQMEMADRDHLVAITTMMDDADDIERLLKAVHEMADAHSGCRTIKYQPSVALPLSERQMPLREAVLGKREDIPLDQADGRIAAASFGAYPPGIPAVCPGEKITREMIRALQEQQRQGARLFGVAEQKIAVVKI